MELRARREFLEEITLMNSWFTVETLDAQTFDISEYSHWEETHCYLLCGSKKAALIDTGLCVCNIKSVVKRLTTLPIIVFTSHVHWDYIGGHWLFDCIAVHEAEKDWISGDFPLTLQEVKKQLAKTPCNFPGGFNINAYRIFQGKPQILLHDGDSFDLGERKLQVIHTPGHSPGHCCFYEPERKFIYCGDLIDTGCLDAFYPSTNPRLFHRSVKRLMTLDIDRVLPGHHDLRIPVSLIGEIEADFSQLESRRQLKQGNGLFDFGKIQIHI